MVTIKPSMYPPLHLNLKIFFHSRKNFSCNIMFQCVTEIYNFFYSINTLSDTVIYTVLQQPMTVLYLSSRTMLLPVLSSLLNSQSSNLNVWIQQIGNGEKMQGFFIFLCVNSFLPQYHLRQQFMVIQIFSYNLL